MRGRFETAVERLHLLHPRLIDLSLGRLEVLLTKLGHPERRLPPVIHVAGTNGKGSTCAFVRAIAEAADLRAHVYTSPHLVRFNERIRLAGKLVSDTELADTLEEVEQVNAGAAITVFEVITAVAFVLFARVPADLAVIEVGLGGRFDATNLVEHPAACAITSVSMDHKEMLGDMLEKIAFEKAGIIKSGVPVVTGTQAIVVLAEIARRATALNAPLLARGRDWTVTHASDGLCFESASGRLHLPPPSLAGAHQIDNAGVAVTALQASGLPISDKAYAIGIGSAHWPARLQHLTGRVAGLLPAGWEVWLDGGHNPGAGQALAEHLRSWADRPAHVVVGMKQSKDSADFLRPIMPLADTLWAVAEPSQHMAQPVESIVAASGGMARPGPTVVAALDAIARTGQPGRVLICGSLYLAGEVLKADEA
jgi:dihydrofolate synthase / folylpolyglutamate synthase